MNTKTGERPTCPDCKVTMGKAGTHWMGKGKKVQIWYCPQCGLHIKTKIEL